MESLIDTGNGAKALAAAALALLAACGGGGGGGGVSVEGLAHGWLPPLETVADQDERALAILPEIDSEFISSSYFESSLPAVGRAITRHRCTGTRAGCVGVYPPDETERSVTHVPADGKLVVNGTRTPFRSRNGVTLIRTHRNVVSPVEGS